ncbi:MBL fold metallo-hydrolase [[Mycobacterium] nativiensis]|uniref:MBL fold metallo-hydrolase n=1 Tax=[Mycobacterium] nativiensis TaxID=2855503 RepID=A0ABU5Y3B4_9MYCO|nr:MBL fold metallo-hydrolase [Mycolicibacter sp. MYC340]MEB3034683.1 MBL fold metallo-hydrolase [Mycolicibacter sp. MYC340]
MLRGAIRLVVGTATLAAGGWTLRALRGTPGALGAAPTEIHTVAARSKHYRDGIFHNLERAVMFSVDRQQQAMVLRELIGDRAAGYPPAPVPLAQPDFGGVAEPLAVTWLGHATALVEVDGYRVLTDPLWSDRCSPSDAVGPKRLHPPPVELSALPAVDAIVISHDHYDHLDIDSVTALARSQRAPFVVPLGVGAHLRAWGIPADRVIELDWDEHTTLGELRLTCTPARHFSGRFLTRNLTLWASWVIAGPRYRIYFGGDSGYTTSFGKIGAEHGPFDVTLLPIGAYNTAWPDVHMNPEEAVRTHLDLNGGPGGTLVPIHWCTFRLAPHRWNEPVERLLVAADDAGVAVAVPQPGQRVTPGVAATAPWWRL